MYLHASSCHVSHCKKSITFRRALRLNRIFSQNNFFDKRWNELEVWLKERGYSDNLVRGKTLKARKYLRSEVLNKQKREGNKNSFVFNITYHPVFSKLIIILSEIHVLLTPDREHRKAFEKVSIIEFRRAKSLKNILVRAKAVPLAKQYTGSTENFRSRFKNCKSAHRNFIKGNTVKQA